MKAICIKCWDPDAVVNMDLHGELDSETLFECRECNECFGRDEVRAALAAVQKGWARLLAWADAYPAEEPAAA